ncbi:hypothetical protein K474DRAFT_312909 [Panus rudis PR-1116 ss-1]|nr:hypothetical protein K474DRAFT_312909 [Panus rudis PR-1116 ss-1]
MNRGCQESRPPISAPLIRRVNDSIDILSTVSASDRLAWIERERANAQEYARVLSVTHNSLLPINRLPSELLSEVLLLLSEQSYTPSEWVRVTHVCQRWRDVALGCPALWTSIDLGNLDCAKTCLARSGNIVDLKVHWSDYWNRYHSLNSTPEDAHALRFISLLLPHICRITSIKLTLHHSHIFAIMSFLDSKPLPRLKSLELEDTSQEGGLPSITFTSHPTSEV